jgi:NADP-dependent 3-hydroxy acid dehydrogenase YdfG
VRLVKSAEQRLGAIDVIVDNAGIQYVSPIEIFRRRNGTRS